MLNTSGEDEYSCFIPDLSGKVFSLSTSNTGTPCFITLHFIAFFYKLKICVEQAYRCHFSNSVSHFVSLCHISVILTIINLMVICDQ